MRSIVLSMQNQDLEKEVDLSDLIPSVFGSAVHAFAENGWNKSSTISRAMEAMGIPIEVQQNVVVNPETVHQGQIPIYIEKRSSRDLNGWTIRGKLDGCIDGKLFDYKITSVWGHIFDSNSEDYSIQGSIYRWLNPTIVKADNVSIEKVFSDWQASKAKYDKNYPKLRVLSKDYPIRPLQWTKEWIANRLNLIDTNIDSPQSELPRCTDDELWASDDIWKYYKKIGAKKATKNFKSSQEANDRLMADGNTGEVVHFPGEVKRCTYCNVIEICEQYKSLVKAGRIK